jgi:hypothetical protein
MFKQIHFSNSAIIKYYQKSKLKLLGSVGQLCGKKRQGWHYFLNETPSKTNELFSFSNVNSLICKTAFLPLHLSFGADCGESGFSLNVFDWSRSDQ